MAENTKNVEFKNPHPELPVREPILKLGKMVTDRAAIKLGLEKLTADDPEYWGLAAILLRLQVWMRSILRSFLIRWLLMV